MLEFQQESIEKRNIEEYPLPGIAPVMSVPVQHDNNAMLIILHFGMTIVKIGSLWSAPKTKHIW